MSTLSREDFPSFFAAVNHGSPPYAWQRDLVDRIAETGWPAQITAPTGAGKSAVIEAHVFSVALARAEGRSIPRRLALCVSRRAIVDAHARRAVEVSTLLETYEHPAVQAVASQLALPGTRPLGVSVVRGGEVVDTEWLDDPVGCHILCTTPDMMGSRLLFQGYRSTRWSRARAAGLLAYDTVVAVDEAHLNRQLTATVRRVGELASASPLARSLPPLQAVEVTATPATTAGDALTVGSAPEDPALQQRLDATKPLHLQSLAAWPPSGNAAARRRALRPVAELAAQMREEVQGTVGVILNSVADALAMTALLSDSGLRTATLVGPLRPVDRTRLEAEYPGLLSPEGSAQVDVLVATQTVEVGVDLDLHGLITDLAAGSTLVQRIGRVNRRGFYEAAPVVVLCPEEPPAKGWDSVRSGPYVGTDLEEALNWLEERGEGFVMSPAHLMADPAPVPSPRRMLFSRLEPAEAEVLASTSESLVVEPDLALWLADELSDDVADVTVVGRNLPVDAPLAMDMVAALPPHSHEMYPVSPGRCRMLLRHLAEAPAQLWRGGEQQRAVTAADVLEQLRPGDVVVLDAQTRAARAGALVVDDPEADPIGDVLCDPLGYPQAVAPVVLLHSEASGGADTHADQPAVDELLDVVGRTLDAHSGSEPADLEDPGSPLSLAVTESLLGRGPAAALWEQAMTTPRAGSEEDPGNWTPTWAASPARTESGAAAWAALTWVAGDTLNAESRQELSGRDVELGAHQRDVAERAREFATRVGLPEPLQEVLHAAGLHHDDGKQAAEFQGVLRNRRVSTEEAQSAPYRMLAKSRRAASRSRARRALQTLPPGWRHEQLSALIAWDEVDGPEPDLVRRLIGTSHGRGRSTFPHGSADLVREDFAHLEERAAELFDSGTWDELIESTHARWGVWGCAYLEAVLRAADTSISKEGR
ncbi:type I-U CRISPR-associated helicase/endonuclease Cas3 [Brachybacterium sp. UMB0905]|uniref:type I-G CRISPR-associated helicase/endonuclease Cas3g n=1 Tax=Brachybacterium sp. UMB0905 TaxID=2069310 RepID=UPI000C7FDDE6|nr:type I-U CRISPR-associated helicase/endonuclease Cas3 [Brachybacterium sp. UMB0905]PMC76072.1 type I-U CRISPR-associated helicase/endonuclease Cas3 [Brachybacterium sp. UMB0905]